MSQQNDRKEKVHGLVLFKTPLENKKVVDEYENENLDQENLIKLLSELAPAGANYRYSIVIANQSLAPITEIKLRIKFPSFLHLTRISPPTVNIKSLDDSNKDFIQVNLEFEELDRNNKQQINLYFHPEILNNSGDISTYITFVNNKDFIRVLNSEPLELTLKPISIEPKIIPSYQVGGFLQKQGIRRAVKSLGIPIEQDTNFGLYFNGLEQILKLNNLHLIAKDETKQILWFFGSDLESKEEILVIAQIISKKIEILAASAVHQILISLLTKIASDFNKRIMGAGIIQSENEILELECKFCGAILPYLPIKGETIRCKNCDNDQTVW